MEEVSRLVKAYFAKDPEVLSLLNGNPNTPESRLAAKITREQSQQGQVSQKDTAFWY